MSTHAIRTTGRFSPAAVAIFLALVLAVSALAIQGRSIWATATHPVVRPPTVRIDDPNRYKNDWRPSETRDSSDRGLSIRQIEARKSG